MTYLMSGRARKQAGACGLAFLAAVVALWVMACGSDERRRTNQPPRVAFFGSPVEGDSVNYVVDFTWIGWDDDGAVVRSEYAVDIPDTFSPEQINDPTTPGIEWIPTTNAHARIRFSVAADSGAAPAGAYLSDRASAPHTFFVRVYDNRGAHSTVADRSFNAWTILPRTTITCPVQVLPFYFTVGPSFSVLFSAEDADGPTPDHRPARTEYKVVRVRGIVSTTDANDVVNSEPGLSLPWLPVPGDSGAVTVSLEPPGAYVLALRSIDEAGGVESRFQFGQNAVLMQSSNAPFVGRPTLTIDEPLLGRVVFPQDGSVVDFEVIAGQCLDFEMSADAQAYGGTVGDFRWCVDGAESPADSGEVPGCVPWGPTHHLPPVCFDTPGIHTVSFAVRSLDPLGACGGASRGASYSMGTVRLNVVPRTFDRGVLYVDDIFKPIDPGAQNVTDASMDQRFLAALHNAGYTNVDSYDAWGPGDINGTVIPLTLEQLSRYRLVFWAVLGAGGGSQNAYTALLQASSCATGRILRAYVAAGGGLWINGELVFGALKDRNNNQGPCRTTTSYSQDVGLSFGPGSFVTDFLHIAGGDIRDAKTGGLVHGLLRAHPTAHARAEGFPTLEADSTMFGYPTLGGLPLYDAMFQPTFYSGEGLDSLYTAEAVRAASPFNGKPIAWRYADPNPTPRQGAVAITSFPLHKMKEGAVSHEVNGVRVAGTGVHGLVEVMGAWFRAHDATRAGMARPEITSGTTRVRARYGGRAGAR